MDIKYSLYLLIFSLLFLGYSCSNTEDEPPRSNNTGIISPGDDGETAPTFSLQTTSGTTIESSQFAGKNLVIFFFGYNCSPCKAVGPDVESRLHQAFKDDSKFAIIGADQWEGNDAGVDNFQETTGITFPLGRKGAQMAKDFGTTYDRIVVVNAEGKIVYRGNSIVANNLDEVVDLVDSLLN